MRCTAFTMALGLLVLAGGADARVKLKEAVPVAKAVAAASAPRPAENVESTVPSAAPASFASQIAAIVATDGPVDSASLVKAFAEASASLSPAEYARLAEEAVERVSPSARLEVAVSAILSAASLEAVREIVPLLAKGDLAAVEPAQIVAVMERIAEAVRGTYTAKGSSMAVGMDRVVSPAWYQMRLYDGGTALWAIAEKAKWFAERGDRKKVEELYAYFLRLLVKAESATVKK